MFPSHDHDGGCANVHGHNYGVEITVRGPIINEIGNSSHGMVVDFGTIKKIYKEFIHDVLDHSLILGNRKPLWYEVCSAYVAEMEHDGDIQRGVEGFDIYLGKVVHLDMIDTTAECLAKWIFDNMNMVLPENVEMDCVRVYETINS